MNRLFALVAAVALAAACSSDTDNSSVGATVPQPSRATASSQPATTSTGQSQYQRPRDIPLDDLDPGTLLTPAQRTELGVKPQPLAGDPELTTAGWLCRFDLLPDRSPQVQFQLMTMLNDGHNWDVALAMEGSSLVTVAGFPAVLELPEGEEAGYFPCRIYVPVADQQKLWFTIMTPDLGSVPPEDAGGIGVRLATMAMETLQAQP